jgi:protein disulfide-isomerase
MRSIFYSLLSLATVATTLAVDKSAKRAATSDDDWDEKVPDTIFNGQTVPPMKELGTDLEEAISHGNWYVRSHNFEYLCADIMRSG